jgi:hypothetical protein
MPVRREGKMKKLALIALIMVLGLSGCASSGTRGSIRQDWIAYWKDPGGIFWEDIKQDWIVYLKNPGGLNWDSIKQDWRVYLKDPGGAFW